MTAVVFETPGLIDVRAFTIMGAHAKPNSKNPIGFFGTGLKYAIAVLVRMGAEPVVWIGKDRFSFAKKASFFRGSPLETITMRVVKDGQTRGRTFEMPYTTAYGRNWKPWQAFRELESNTRDEGGKTYTLDTRTYGDNRLVRDRFSLDELIRGEDGKTKIVVDNDEFAEAAANIDSIFLPRARRDGTLLEAIERPNDAEDNFVYYRTMRAYDAGKPTLFTYNLLELMTLTEDRTLAYGFQVRDVVARWVLTEATEEQVELVLTADEEWWEHGLEFPGRVPPSAAFRAVMLRRPKGLSRYAHGYYAGWSGGRVRRERPGFMLFSTCPKPWRVEGDAVFDSNGNAVFERPRDMGAENWDAISAAIIKRLDVLPLPGPAPEPVVIDAEAVS